MHDPRPWFRASKKAWYLQVGKRQICLGRDAKLAKQKAREILAGNIPAETSKVTFAQLCDEFLEFSKHEHQPDTYDWFRWFLTDCCEHVGSVRAADLRPIDVHRWVRGRSWSQSTLHSALTCVKRVYNWAADEGLITVNPVKSLKKPAIQRRERILTPEERKKMLAAVK